MSLLTPRRTPGPLTADRAAALGEDFSAFCSELGLDLYLWQRAAFPEGACRRSDGRFLAPLAGVSVPRGNGKSWGAAAVGAWRFRFGPQPQTILSVGLMVDGARIILDHARRLLRRAAWLEAGVEQLADGFLIPATGSRWIIRSRDHESSRGEHPDLVTYDECGWARDDELFSSLLASQASVLDPLMLVVSTVGRRKSGPLWRLKEMGEAGEPGVFWYYSAENGSPRIGPAFLERQRRLLLPAQFAREHQNQWVDQADAFVTQFDVDAAMASSAVEGMGGAPSVIAVDIGAVHDPTVIGAGHRAGVRIIVDRLLTLQGSREAPVQMSAVEAAIRQLATHFAPVTKIRIESWQGMATAQSLTRLGLPVELYTPTAKSHAEEWPLLAQALAAHTLRLPPHARLREELLNLVYEVGPTGVRVSDRGQIHQDHAVVVRMLVAALAAPGPPPLMIYAVGGHNSVLTRPDGSRYGPAVSAFLRGD